MSNISQYRPSDEKTEKRANEDKDNIFHLFTKHELYADIWMVLSIYPELNVTEMSKLVKQSKSTVSRYLTEMESDGFILSREKESSISGRIPSKCYKINPNAFKGQHDSIMALPTDPVKRLEYIKGEIRMYHYFAYEVQKTMDYLNKVMNDLNHEASTIEKGDEIFNTYLSGKLEPFLMYSFHTEAEFKQLVTLIEDFITKKNICCSDKHKDQDMKDGKEYCFFLGTMPLKAFLERLAKKGKQDAKQDQA